MNSEPRAEEKGIFNPLMEDFTVNYDIDGNLSPKPFTAKSLEITYFPEPIYTHVKTALADAIINKREINPVLEHKRREVEEEITQ